MSGVLLVLLYAALPAAGNVVGGIPAEVAPLTRRSLAVALHAAAGTVIAIVAVELMPEALAIQPPWRIVAAFVAGGLFFVAVDELVDLVEARLGGGEGEAAGRKPWLLFAGVALDLLTDRVMIGTAVTVRPAWGLILALGQMIADVPSGLRDDGHLPAAGRSLDDPYPPGHIVQPARPDQRRAGWLCRRK